MFNFGSTFLVLFLASSGDAGAPTDTEESPTAAPIVCPTTVCEEVGFAPIRPPEGTNICEGKDPGIASIPCFIDDVVNAVEQAGGDVTLNYKGSLETNYTAMTGAYWTQGICPVNVHWHLGTEHISEGQYTLNGTGPTEIQQRRKLAGKTRLGGQCLLYDEKDVMYTTAYDWKYCTDMEVGQTYEVHWPHSRAGACGTLNQYQTPFKDGVFCRDEIIADLPADIGVQAQVYVVVNDESFYYPDLMRGMIVDADSNIGMDITAYTGSTTGTKVNNTLCSGYAPITWQVDRNCVKVSASSFDKLCSDMLSQRDDMSDDVYPHGSREIVIDNLTANNQQFP